MASKVKSFSEISDPSLLFDYLYKYVQVTFKSSNKFVKSKSVFGWVYTIDPVSMRLVE